MKKLAWLSGLLAFLCFSAYASQSETAPEQFGLVKQLVTSFDSQNNNGSSFEILKQK